MRLARMLIRFSAAATSICVLFASAHARADVVSLRALETRAVAKRASIASARAAIEGARAGVSLVHGEASPKFSMELQSNVASGGQLVEVVDATGNRYLVQGTRPLGDSGAFTPQIRYGALLSMETPIYDFGRTRALDEAARARVQAASAAENAARAHVVRDVRRAYLAWVSAHAAYALVQKDLDAARNRRKAMEAAVRDGLEPPRDLASIRYEESLAEIETARARADLRVAMLGVARSVGEALPPGAQPDAGLLEKAATFEKASTAPELDALNRQKVAADAMARAKKADHLPVFGAGMQGGVQGQNNRFFPAYRAGISLSIPIWDGGVADARSDVARAEALELDGRAKEYRNAFDSEREQANMDFADASERLKLANTLLQNAAERVRAAEERQTMGEVTPDIVLQARSDLRHAEREVLSAKVSRMDAAFRLADPGASLPPP